MTDQSSANQILIKTQKSHAKGNFEAAEKGYLELLQFAPGHPDVTHLLGVLYGQAGHLEDSERLIREAIEIAPDDADKFYNLGNILIKLKCEKDAVTAFGKAVEMAPENAGMIFNLALSQTQTGDHEQAERSFRRVIALDDTHANAMAELSALLGQRGVLEEANSLQQQAIDLQPDVPNFQFNLGLLLLRREQWEPAIKCFNQTLVLQQWHVPALAAKAVALYEIGEDQESQKLVNIQNGLEITELSLPDDVDVGVLADKLANHNSCVWDRSDITTRDGAQTTNLIQDEDPDISALISALTRAVKFTIDEKQPNANNPFLARIPEEWDYSIWATILNKEGHQLPHLHPAAWLSGVFYLEVPLAVIEDENEDQQGWIEFGTPGYGIDPVRPHIVRRIRPEPGKLVLFPSHYFHCTLPLSGEMRRISIAFDVIPTKWRK
jgi:tetratricopeptide (TPR) repeat protein